MEKLDEFGNQPQQFDFKPEKEVLEVKVPNHPEQVSGRGMPVDPKLEKAWAHNKDVEFYDKYDKIKEDLKAIQEKQDQKLGKIQSDDDLFYRQPRGEQGMWKASTEKSETEKDDKTEPAEVL